MHANAATEVVYAGEFHFRKGNQQKGEPLIRIVLDNNSGTYSPSKDDLPKLKEVFQRNFAGLPVEVLDYKDPRLKQYREQLLSKHHHLSIC